MIETEYALSIRDRKYRTENDPISLFEGLYVIDLAPVVRKLDSAIHRINCYPEDKYYDIQLRYPVDSNLSSG